MAKSGERKLHICIDKGTGDVFFASMVGRKNLQADMRTSYQIEKGKSLIMMPVPEGWNGETIEKETIQSSPDSFEAHVTRMEGRGSFTVRIMSDDQRYLADLYRSGVYHEGSTKVEVSEAGLVVTIKMIGNYGTHSAIRLESAIRDLAKKQKLVLLDLTDLTYHISSGLGMLYTVIKTACEKGLKIHILAKPDTRMRSALLESKVDQMAKVYSDRDSAIAGLLMNTIES